MEQEDVVNHVPNAAAWEWIAANIPLFECPDRDFEEIYYFRWWTLRKHIKQTPDGFVFSEFITPVGHAGEYNTISCAFGHHAREARWLKEQKYLEDYITFWLRKNDGGPQSHFHKYSSWFPWALYDKYMVDGDREFLIQFLPDLIADFEQWHTEQLLPDSLYWQYDVRDGMEESISGSRKAHNARPTINSYMYANALAISKIAALAGENGVADNFARRAEDIKRRTLFNLWDEKAGFFKVRFEDGRLSDALEEIGFVPWYFNLPEEAHSVAWKYMIDTTVFKAPYGITTADQSHPAFRSHGVGTCEWDGAVWPFATSQTLTGLANLLNDYQQQVIGKEDYFDALLTYARSHQKRGKPYIGEYLDERTGEWLKGDNPRSRYYNHSTFCDLVITGLAGLRPRDDNTIVVNPLLPENSWDWFALDRINYHGKALSIFWDRTGQKYHLGKGLFLFVDGKLRAHSDGLSKLSIDLRDVE